MRIEFVRFVFLKIIFKNFIVDEVRFVVVIYRKLRCGIVYFNLLVSVWYCDKNLIFGI